VTPRLSILVVTAGRPTLERTLRSIEAQPLEPGDEVLVVGNGAEIELLAKRFGYRYIQDGPYGCWGQRERQSAMFKARGTHLLFIDDDDFYLSGAFAAIRQAIVEHPTSPHLFKMHGPVQLGTLWKTKVVACGNISGTQFVVPNDDRLGRWGQRYEGDFDFISSTLRNYPFDALRWHETVIVGCRDQGVPATTQTGRPLRVLLAHPGASWSTADVYDGLNYGLQQLGVHVVPYRLDTRIEASHRALHFLWRTKKRRAPELEKPNAADVMYHASVGVLEMALRERVDVVLVVSAMLVHPDVLIYLRQAGLRVTVLFTESPYDHGQEMRIASLVDGCWTNERSVLEEFRRVNRCSGYLPHAWHPGKHYTAKTELTDLPSHDVVFVGTCFPERETFFNGIDWTGIDLGLYGTWKTADDGEWLGIKDQVKACVRGDQITNEMAAALYRRAKIGLNLYRKSRGWGRQAPFVTGAESLSPRAYELAACGVFHLSDARPEVAEVFGDLVPTFSTPAEAEALIRRWLPDAEGRARVAAQLPACVAEASWTHRAKTVLGDLERLLTSQAA
jgi:spore maturation protein CgeB